MRIALIVALCGVGGALGGCVRPPPPVALHHRPVYRGGPVPPPVVASERPVRPDLPLPVPPEPVSAAAAACAARPGTLPEARKEQLFKDFTQWESHKPTTATAASAPPPSPGEPSGAAACGPAP